MSFKVGEKVYGTTFFNMATVINEEDGKVSVETTGGEVIICKEEELSCESPFNKDEHLLDVKKFKEACLPLIKYLAENHHPHTYATVTSTDAQLLEGVMSTGPITDYLRD